MPGSELEDFHLAGRGFSTCRAGSHLFSVFLPLATRNHHHPPRARSPSRYLPAELGLASAWRSWHPRLSRGGSAYAAVSTFQFRARHLAGVPPSLRPRIFLSARRQSQSQRKYRARLRSEKAAHELGCIRSVAGRARRYSQSRPASDGVRLDHAGGGRARRSGNEVCSARARAGRDEVERLAIRTSETKFYED